MFSAEVGRRRYYAQTSTNLAAPTWTMRKHTEFPSLVETLPALIHKQRRLLAGQLRITAEERALRAEIAELLAAAGAGELTCECEVGGVTREFELRPYQSSRDGKRRVKVFPRR